MVKGTPPGLTPATRGLLSFTFQLNLSRVCQHKDTLHNLDTPKHPLKWGYATPTRTPYPMKGAQVELRSERV